MLTITKLGPDLKFVKIKARLVAGGHRETMDPDHDTFSPTVKTETLMFNLSIAATKDMDIDSSGVSRSNTNKRNLRNIGFAK